MQKIARSVFRLGAAAGELGASASGRPPLSFKPKTLKNLKLETELQTLNPKPQTLNPKNPKP